MRIRTVTASVVGTISLISAALITPQLRGGPPEESGLPPEFQFRTPHQFVDEPTELYVWTPRYAYYTKDKIPLYCEMWASPARTAHWGVAQVPMEQETFLWEALFRFRGLKHCMGGFSRPKLLIRRAPFQKPMLVALKKFEEMPKYPPEVLFPDPEKIPCHWLHGMPVKYKEVCKFSIYSEKDWSYSAEITLPKGGSFVRLIPDLLECWVTKKDENGRLYVKCIVPAPNTFWGVKSVWLPIEGRYRLQFWDSNIIEFEIRQ